MSAVYAERYRDRTARPSLRITRHQSVARESDFSFEVWSPFTGSYQAVISIEDGLRRVDQLAGLIRQMSVKQHPKRNALLDTPAVDPVGTESAAWAEFRVNATTERSYDTRCFDRLPWVRVGGMEEAAAAIFARVGYSRADGERRARDGS
jgi:hypothetical protein